MKCSLILACSQSEGCSLWFSVSFPFLQLVLTGVVGSRRVTRHVQRSFLLSFVLTFETCLCSVWFCSTGFILVPPFPQSLTFFLLKLLPLSPNTPIVATTYHLLSWRSFTPATTPCPMSTSSTIKLYAEKSEFVYSHFYCDVLRLLMDFCKQKEHTRFTPLLQECFQSCCIL